MSEILWQWCRFDALSQYQLYEVMQARQDVFAVEQNCVYRDADGADQFSWHLIGRKKDELLAYCRVVDPGVKYMEVSIGRVLTTAKARGTGLGKALLAKAITQIEKTYPASPIRISAQHYLQRYYQGFGFNAVSRPYDEDGIWHIEMLRPVA